MAIFTVEFARGSLPGPEYEDYFVGVTSICFDDARQHPIKFNDNITGDYVVGWNWSNPSTVINPGTIRLESFTDTTEVIELSTGIVVPNTVPSNTLKDISTGSNLTYPYVIPMSQLGNIQENFNSSEIYCEDGGSSKYKTTRTRRLEYIIFDTDGVPGPLRVATYQNIAPV